MTRPPLTVALSSVLTAAIDGAGRPGLLATLHPEFGRALPRTDQDEAPQDAAGLAQVITMPRVIPMPRRGPAPDRGPEQYGPEHPDPDPFSAA